MFLTKKALESVRLASRDDPRFAINGIRVEADGSTVATDGHKLIRYTPAGLPGDQDAPAIDGVSMPANAPDLEPFILSADACKAIGKALPKRATLPVLAYAQLDTAATNENGHAVIGVTDLESPQVFKPAKLEGSFPKYEAVIPKPENELCFVGLDVSYLIQIGQTLKAQGFKRVRLSMQKDDPGRDTYVPERGTTKPAGTEDKPVVFTAKNEDGKATVVLMPMHL